MMLFIPNASGQNMQLNFFLPFGRAKVGLEMRFFKSSREGKRKKRAG